MYGQTCYPTTDTIGYARENKIINREDVILTDGGIINNEDDSNGLFSNAIANVHNIFADNRFRDANCTLKVFVPYILHYDIAHIIPNRLAITATVRVMSLTEAEFQYLKALNCLQSDNYDETLMEPVILPNNVKGGLGFVGVSSETNLRLPLIDVNIAP